MDNLIKNPEDYLSEISSDLQTSLSIKDTKLLTTGPLSVLANLLSNISFDAQKYYEYVTKEFNVATAQRYKSMLFHASTYSYNLELALPATVDPIILIPVAAIGDGRKLSYVIPVFTTFEINNTVFRISGEVDIEITDDSVTAIIKRGINEYRLNMYQSTYNGTPMYYIQIPKEMVLQVNRAIEKFVVPDYSIGDTVNFSMQIPEGNEIYKIKAFVNSYKNSPISETDLENIDIDQISERVNQLEEYELKYFKFNTTPNDKVVFLDAVDPQNLSFTLGNDVYGYKLHVNDELFIVAEYTKGAGGNVSPGDSQLENILFYKIDTETNNTLIFNTTSLKVITTQPAVGGKDEDDIESIRFDILKNITERKSLVTQLDFQKYFADPVTNQLACVISRQLSTVSPFVTVYNVLKNPYTFDIVKTVTLNKPSADCFTDAQPWIINPQEIYNNLTVVSQFTYIKSSNQVWSYFMHTNISIPLTIVKINANPEISPALTINWDDVNQYFYFKSNDLGTDYKIKLETNAGTYELNSENGFQINVTDDSMLHNRFFKDDLKFNKVSVIRTSDDFEIHVYSVTDTIPVMIRIQRHPEYEFADGTKKVLFMPFVSQDYFNNMNNDSKYTDVLLDFFSIKNPEVSQMKIFNITLNQSFMNTIDVDQVSTKGVIENNNSDLLAEYSVDITVLFDIIKMETKGLTLFNLKTDTQLAVLDFLNSIQGNSIKYYETELIKLIKNLYPDVILDVQVQSPRTLVTQDWAEILEENELTADEILESCPAYFYFNINNMQINFQLN